MKSAWGVCILLIPVALTAACSFKIFEDVGSAPHPPQIQLLGIAYQPEAATDPAETPVPVFQAPDGFVVRPGDPSSSKLVFRVQYTDGGGDITSFKIIDLDGPFTASPAPTAPVVDLDGDGLPDVDVSAPDFFLGTTNVVDLGNVTFTSGIDGAHRLEIWAEDSHDSRSEKVAFTITVVNL